MELNNVLFEISYHFNHIGWCGGRFEGFTKAQEYEVQLIVEKHVLAMMEEIKNYGIESN